MHYLPKEDTIARPEPGTTFSGREISMLSLKEDSSVSEIIQYIKANIKWFSCTPLVDMPSRPPQPDLYCNLNKKQYVRVIYQEQGGM